MTQPSSSARDDQPAHRYTAAMAEQIETKWQEQWDQRGTFVTPNPGQPAFDATKPKFFCLDMFPYPSGAGLHVGHPEGYTATDIISRYKRMKGFNVLHPMGWDAFGLPAEQYAIQTGIHPSITTRKAIETFRRQLKRFGFSYDWSREFATIDENYYKWTQWIFLRIYNAWYDAAADHGRGKARPIAELVGELENGHWGINPSGDLVAMQGRGGSGGGMGPALGGEPIGIRMWHELTQEERHEFIDDQRLAYLGEQTVNWCPKLGTVLANEEVIDGKSERGGFPVYRRTLKQWMFRITAYAQRLLDDLAALDWPESTRTMQTEWIGKSEGAEVEFELDLGSDLALGGLPLRGGRNADDPSPAKPRTPAPLQEVAARFTRLGAKALRPIGFVGRNPYPPGIYGPARDLIWKQHNLPHLSLPGATYFVTWKTSEDLWLNEAERDAVMKSLLHFDGDRCRIYAVVVMANHIHWIVRPFDNHTLEELVASVKNFSATEVNKLKGTSGHVWGREHLDHIIRDPLYFNEFVQYIVENPVEAGVVTNAAEYAWTFVHADCLVDAPAAERQATQSPEESVGGFTSLTIYTTRPDTLFGATYMVIAPEHPLVEAVLSSPAQVRNGASIDAIGAYVTQARNKADVDRMADAKEKTGVFSGIYAINPATGERIPVWIADYVLMGVGHGAIMAVPAHDQRDYEFAAKFGLPIRDVVYPRVIAAMSHFAAHAEDKHKLPDAWSAVLADMLGYVTSLNIPPERFPDALRLVSTRRRNDAPLAFDVNPKIARDEQSQEVPERRGLTRLTWLDFIEGQGFTTFASLKARMDTGRFQAEEGAAFTGPGYAANSANDEVSLNGLSTEDARVRIVKWLEDNGIGRRKTNFKLRDWLFSRQRYWGEPFPIVYDAAGNHYPISESALPVKLPEMERFKPPESDDPAPMLAAAVNWVHTTAGQAGVSPSLLSPETPIRREANTMPNWAGSCWYYLRYCDPKNAGALVGRDAEKYWMGSSGVDLYVGGSEHAVLHLLYARFWHKALFDLGFVSTSEPAKKLFHQGLITAYSFQRPDKTLAPNDTAEEVGDNQFIERGTGVKLTPVIAKMSKTLKNVVNPDDVIAEYGADTMRLYEMYMGPLDASKPWNPRDITGCYRFLQRAWRLVLTEDTGKVNLAAAANEDAERALHRLIAKVGPDVERLAFNTAIAAMMEFVKLASAGEGKPSLTQSQADRFALVIAPFAPHFAEELWSRLGHASMISLEKWPDFDPSRLVDNHIEIPIQLMGKVRAHITVAAGSDAKTIEAAALAEPRVKALVEGKTIKKIIVVPGKMVNIVAG